jgi:hypothetical protein
MHTWSAFIENDMGDVSEYVFANRPLISTGDGMVRLASNDIEYWVRQDQVSNIYLMTTSDMGLMELFNQKDLDKISDDADRMSRSDNPDEAVMGLIVLQAIKHYKAVSAFLDYAKEWEEAGEGMSEIRG